MSMEVSAYPQAILGGTSQCKEFLEAPNSKEIAVFPKKIALWMT